MLNHTNEGQEFYNKCNKSIFFGFKRQLIKIGVRLLL